MLKWISSGAQTYTASLQVLSTKRRKINLNHLQLYNCFLKNKKYYSFANCKYFFYHTHSRVATLCATENSFHFHRNFSCSFTLNFSHTGMASIFNYRLLFTMCATVRPCNFNFNIQLLVCFNFLSNVIGHICMASIF